MVYRFGCLNVRNLKSSWKRGWGPKWHQVTKYGCYCSNWNPLLPLLSGYKKFISPYHPLRGDELLMLIKRNRVSEKKLVFFWSGRLVVLEQRFSCDKMIRLVAVYTPQLRKSDYYRDLERFLGTPHVLVLLGNYNSILDARVDMVGSLTRRANSGFQNLLIFTGSTILTLNNNSHPGINKS